MSYNYSNLLIIFAKAPIEGQVKTRLMPDFSAQEANLIHQQLLEFTIRQILPTAQTDIQLHCAPDSQHSFFQYLKAQYNLQLEDQSPGDLGQRMSHALLNGLLQYQKVILIGSDAPVINSIYLQHAFDKLERHPVVLGPAEDGGYALVGLNKPQTAMFDDIDWGSDQVLQQTISRMAPEIPLLLDTLWDVDRPEDVPRFKKLLCAP